MTAWLSIAAGIAASVIVVLLRSSIKREQRAEDRAEVAEQNAADLKTYVGKNFGREKGHVKRVENILSGVSRADAGRMLSTFPKPDQVSQARKARP